jgi:RHS repeat-associated protein
VSPVSGSGKGVTFQYDYQGRRVEKAVYDVSGGSWGWTPSSLERYVYDGWNVVEMLDGLAQWANSAARRYTWGLDLSQSLKKAGGIGGLLAALDAKSGSPGWLYFYDGNGNVGQIVDLANNSIAAQYEYDAFGNLTVCQGSLSLSNPYRFSTKAMDDETGLSYFGYRYYSPKLGRWISRDPLQEIGGLNLYGYVQNSPIGLVDPLGEGILDTIKSIFDWGSKARDAKDDADLVKSQKDLQDAADQASKAGQNLDKDDPFKDFDKFADDYDKYNDAFGDVAKKGQDTTKDAMKQKGTLSCPN